MNITVNDLISRVISKIGVLATPLPAVFLQSVDNKHLARSAGCSDCVGCRNGTDSANYVDSL